MTKNNTQYKELEDITVNAMMSLKARFPKGKSLYEVSLFVCPMIGQVAAANRSIDVLIEAGESACLGLICRQIFEILVSLEYMFSIFHLRQELFHGFCNFFIEHGRIGEYNEKKKKWVKARMSTLCENYAKNSGNSGVDEIYRALCQMAHFSSMHTGESLSIDGDTLSINVSGKLKNANKIYQDTDLMRNELTRLIIEAIRREFKIS